MGGTPHWAPNEMPDVAYDPDSEVQPFQKRWAAARMQTGQYAVCVEETFDETTGQALTVAMCPAGEFAQYIAYFHNMLLKGTELMSGTTIEDILKDYAKHGPTGAPRPEETGGYL